MPWFNDLRRAWEMLLQDRLDDVDCSMSTLQYRDRQLAALEDRLGRLARPLDCLSHWYCRWVARRLCSGAPYEG
ncbi:MAG: hypothetical protein KKA73_18580 [Chloroflexi bacterium]|nr:hypothetical protein [Chloroflexota bacterium]